MSLAGALVTREHVPFKVIGTPPANVASLRLFPWVATSVFLFLSTVSLMLRLYIRLKLQGKMRLEDYLILPGYIIALMPAICIYILLETGFGYHMANLEPATIKSFLKADFALQRANQPALGFIKISILVFYMGIFPTRNFTIAAYINIAYTLLWAIIGWCINLTVCHPVSFFYDRTTPGGYCNSQQVSGAVNGGLGVLGDVAILVLPLFMIRRLQLNIRKKIAVSGIFLLGAFGLRIWAVSLAPPQDVTFAQVTASTWTAIEMQVAILSANLPTLAPLFEHFLRNRKTSRPSHGREHGYHGSYHHSKSGGRAGGGAGGLSGCDSHKHSERSERSVSGTSKDGGLVSRSSARAVWPSGRGGHALGRVLGGRRGHQELHDDLDAYDDDDDDDDNLGHNTTVSGATASSDDDYSYENTSEAAFRHAAAAPSQSSSSDTKALHPHVSQDSQGESLGPQSGRHGGVASGGGGGGGRHRGFERMDDSGRGHGEPLPSNAKSHAKNTSSLGTGLGRADRGILVKTELSSKVEAHNMTQKDKEEYELRVINGWQRG